MGDSVSGKLQIYDDVIANLSGITLAIAVLVLGVAAMRDEQDGGTLPFLYLSPIPRWRFAAASWIGASGVATLVAVGGWAIGWLGMGLSAGDWSHPLAVLPAYVAAALGYTAIFLPVGYLFKRATLAGSGIRVCVGTHPDERDERSGSFVHLADRAVDLWWHPRSVRRRAGCARIGDTQCDGWRAQNDGHDPGRAGGLHVGVADPRRFVVHNGPSGQRCANICLSSIGHMLV